MFASGKKAGLFFPHEGDEVRLPRPGETWHLVEGCKDAAALQGLGLLACGENTCRLAAKFARLFQGVKIILVPDRDAAGEEGARHFARVLRGVASSVRVAVLPAEFKSSDGEDVRDVLRRSGGRELVLQAIADAQPVQHISPSSSDAEDDNPLPLAILPGGPQRVLDSAEQFGKLLAATGRHFLRGGAVVKLVQDECGARRLQPLKPASMPAVFEQVARLVKATTKDGEVEYVATTCNEQTAKILLHSEPFQQAPPPIRVVARCPVLVKRDGRLLQVTDYHRESGILAEGEPAPDVPLDDARYLLCRLLADFRFATAGDRSRALAAMIMLGLVLGGLLKGRAQSTWERRTNLRPARDTATRSLPRSIGKRSRPSHSAGEAWAAWKRPSRRPDQRITLHRSGQHSRED